MDHPIYLDHNATTPLAAEALEAMLPFLREEFGNPSSAHVLGRRARDAVERARGQVAKLLGAHPWEIVFTGSGTESNNLAIQGVVRAGAPERRHLVLSAVEHAAVTSPMDALVQEGCRVSHLPVGQDGVIKAGWEDVIQADTALVSVMHANNETGAVQPIAALAARAKAVGARMHTDAAQTIGKVKVDVNALGVDLLTVVAHKFYGPKGVGALYIRSGTPIRPFVLGAGHELGRRAGTENVAGIVGLGVAAELAASGLEVESARLEKLRAALLQALLDAIPGLQVNGPQTQRLANTLNVSFPGVSGSAVLQRAPGIAASTGSACHGDEESGVLGAMGLPADRARGAVRLSLGKRVKQADVPAVVEMLKAAWLAAK